MNAGEVMPPDPVTVDVDATVGEGLEILHSLDVRHLPIVEGSVLVGLVEA